MTDPPASDTETETPSRVETAPDASEEAAGGGDADASSAACSRLRRRDGGGGKETVTVTAMEGGTRSAPLAMEDATAACSDAALTLPPDVNGRVNTTVTEEPLATTDTGVDRLPVAEATATATDCGVVPDAAPLTVMPTVHSVDGTHAPAEYTEPGGQPGGEGGGDGGGGGEGGGGDASQPQPGS